MMRESLVYITLARSGVVVILMATLHSRVVSLIPSSRKCSRDESIFIFKQASEANADLV